MKKTVIIDNFDSFTYNLVHYIEEINTLRPTVYRNNDFELSDLEQFDVIVLSPGPGLPKDAGLMPEVLKMYANSKIILGVCLGHQAIGAFFGGTLKNLSKVYHGVDCVLENVTDELIFKNIPNPVVGRYHSWVVDTVDFPSDLLITSTDKEGEVMSLKHKKLPIYGVQFHPESVLTPKGKDMIRNFFNAV